MQTAIASLGGAPNQSPPLLNLRALETSSWRSGITSRPEILKLFSCIGVALVVVASVLIVDASRASVDVQAGQAARELTPLSQAPAAVSVDSRADVDDALSAVKAAVVSGTQDFEAWRSSASISVSEAVTNTAPAAVALTSADHGVDLQVAIAGNAAESATLNNGYFYSDIFASTDLVVQTSDNGSARFISIMDGPDAATAIPFEFTEATLGASSLNADGSVSIADELGQLVARIKAPWAYDANGANVPSWFTVEGSTVTLNVDHAAATAYPVVADPSFWWWSKNIAWCAGGIATLALSFSAKAALAASKILQLMRSSQTIRIAVSKLGGATSAFKSMLGLIGTKVGAVASKLGIRAPAAWKVTQLRLLGRRFLDAVIAIIVGGSCKNIAKELLGL